MTLFTRFVEPGRLCVIQYGPDQGKKCFIVDIINNNRVLVDGGKNAGVPRQAVPTRRLALTDFKVKLPRGARSSTLQKTIKDSDVLEKFDKSSWGKKLQKWSKKSEMTDFDRFKLNYTKKAIAKKAKTSA